MEKNIYEVVPAPPELKRYLRSYMIADSANQGEIAMPVRPTGYYYFGWVLAHSDSTFAEFGTQNLEVKSETTHLSGQVSDDNIGIRYQGAVRHILAEFTATGLYELFNVKAQPWTNICAGGTTVCSAMKEIESFLVNESKHMDDHSIDYHKELLSSALIAQSEHSIKAPDYVSKAVKEIELKNGLIHLAELSGELNISSRQLNQKFTEIVGISPKYFAGILQINRVVRAMLENDSSYLADLAQVHGFFDQSHLIKTAQKFLGAPPLEFLNSEEEILFTFLGKSR